MGEDDKERLVRRQRRQYGLRLGLPIARVARERVGMEGLGMASLIKMNPPSVSERDPLRARG